MKYIIGLCFDALSYILSGWGLTILWGWFIVPKFELEALSIPQAIGFMLVIAFVTKSKPIGDEDEDEDFEVTWNLLWQYFTNILVNTFWPLMIGWIVVEYFI